MTNEQLLVRCMLAIGKISNEAKAEEVAEINQLYSDIADAVKCAALSDAEYTDKIAIEVMKITLPVFDPERFIPDYADILADISYRVAFAMLKRKNIGMTNEE